MEVEPAQTTLRDIQLCELDILCRFSDVCEAHGLTYYMVGGTLLGAARTQGFIPWDDDIDVAMPRDDYERLASLYRENNGLLGEQFFYQDHTTEPHYYLPYAKIRKRASYACEPEFAKARYTEQGVFIDIFPLDPCPPKSASLRFCYKLLAVIHSRTRVLSGCKKPQGKRLIWHIAYLVTCLIPAKWLLRIRDRILAHLRKKSNGEWFASFSGSYGYPLEIFDAKIYGNGVKLEFERRYFNAPTDYVRQLRQIYGNSYMDLPEQKQRKLHIDVENSYTEVNR
ncbi:MAG: LicD family protein [Clostridia bacterium]|nr:LicD family protein [Clostridia bacterium]